MKLVVLALLLAWHPALVLSERPLVGGPVLSERQRVEGCFLLYEVGKGEVRRRPADICTTRLLPASTFKIPHALAALDAGVVSGADEVIKYDGAPTTMEAWRHDHTLQTAMRDSVVWYFQHLARRLGMERERAYLRRFDYGNADPSSGLTTFWLGGSLQIRPEEQLRFMQRLYRDELPASPSAMRIVRQLIVQPPSLCRALALRHDGQCKNGKRHRPRWPIGPLARRPRGARRPQLDLRQLRRRRRRYPRAGGGRSGRGRLAGRGGASLASPSGFRPSAPLSIAVDRVRDTCYPPEKPVDPQTSRMLNRRIHTVRRRSVPPSS